MRLLATILSVALIAPLPGTAMAEPKSPKLSRCDGKSRRPANPYGSILPTVDPASGSVKPAAAASGSVHVFPPADPAKPTTPPTVPPPPDASATPVPPIGAALLAPQPGFGSC